MENEFWEMNAESIRSLADKHQLKAAEKMVKSHTSKYPPSVYQTGEEVMIKTPFTGEKIKGKKKFIFKRKILKKNENRYKIEYQKSGKLDT